MDRIKHSIDTAFHKGVLTPLEYLRAQVQYDKLVKAATGEGSRGGHVIGHTSTGKPVYDKFGHKGHKNFTKQDHRDATDVHDKYIGMQDVNTTYGEKTKKEHEKQSRLHEDAVLNYKESPKIDQSLLNKFDEKWVKEGVDDLIKKHGAHADATRKEIGRLHIVLATDASNPANGSIKQQIEKLTTGLSEHSSKVGEQIKNLKKPSEFMTPEQLQYHMEEHFKDKNPLPKINEDVASIERYTPKFLEETGHEFVIGKYKNGEHYLYHVGSGRMVPANSGNYVERDRKPTPGVFGDTGGKELHFVSDRRPKFNGDHMADVGFKTIKELKHFYDNVMPKNPKVAKSLPEMVRTAPLKKATNLSLLTSQLESIVKATKPLVLKTTSGKQIHDHFDSDATEDYEAQDHLDAARYHAKEYAKKKEIKHSHASLQHFLAAAAKKGKDGVKHTLEQLVAHVENTSEQRLKEVAKNHSNQHLRDLAARELERRKPKPVKK